MLSVEWIDGQLAQLSAQEASLYTVRDMAALITVRSYLQSPAAQPLSTLEEIENALSQLLAHTPDEARRLRDAQTMASIMSGKNV